MGINKSNVRFVLHDSVPANIESYYQEAGRAGRDGLASEAVLLFQAKDIRLRRFFIENSEGDERYKQNEFEKLQEMQFYANSSECLQKMIVEYFGEKGEACGKCSNCTDDRERVDKTREAQMVLSCAKRMNERFGKTMIANVLVGSRNQNVMKFNFEKLPTYGLMRGKPAKKVIQFIDSLTASGFLDVQIDGKFSRLLVSESGIQVLLGKEKVEMRQSKVEKKINVLSNPKQNANQAATVIDENLFELLRQKRLEIARETSVPPFVIFSDKSLKEMAQIQPTDAEQFLTVTGVGEHKLEKFGELFMQIIRDYLDK